MTIKPIIFSGPMVLALLEGRKTQTRRILKPLPRSAPIREIDGIWTDHDGLYRRFDESTCFRSDVRPLKVPFAPGDLLYVREAWRTWDTYDDLSPSEIVALGAQAFWTEADNKAHHPYFQDDKGREGRKRPSIHMPRAFSRLTLPVSDVRVQRLQDMTEDDAEAEGCVYAEEVVEITSTPSGQPREVTDDRWRIPGVTDDCDGGFEYGVDCFADLWNALHGPEAWDANPWVYATTFSVEKRNVDQTKETEK